MTDARADIDRLIEAAQVRFARLEAENRQIVGEHKGLVSALEIIQAQTTSVDRHVIDELAIRVRATSLKLRRHAAELEELSGEIEGLRQARLVAYGDEGVPEPEINLPTGRGISTAWKKILNYFLQKSPNYVSISEVMQFISENELGISRNAVRSQLHLYEQRGFLKRVSEGEYKATGAIKRVC